MKVHTLYEHLQTYAQEQAKDKYSSKFRCKHYQNFCDYSDICRLDLGEERVAKERHSLEYIKVEIH